MTPYEIRILLHYHVCAEDYEGRDEPILQPTLDQFVTEALLEIPKDFDYRPGQRKYRMTERGHCYCEALASVPPPRATWTIDFPNHKLTWERHD